MGGGGRGLWRGLRGGFGRVHFFFPVCFVYYGVWLDRGWMGFGKGLGGFESASILFSSVTGWVCYGVVGVGRWDRGLVGYEGVYS